MPTVGLFNKEGKKVGDIELNENIFAVEVNEDAYAPSSCCIIS